MEAIEIYREEERKMAEHRQDCIDSEKEVGVACTNVVYRQLVWTFEAVYY